ncbi:protein zntD [Diachasmimorpha longicaudata]|uniref:protein zntD n=1 Tax=Diachasmimorpha longicaudata TaxID=58733 RepID=UPI0030B8B570
MALTIIELKFMSMFTIGVTSFIVGLIPGCLFNRGRSLQRRLYLSALLCFGGGVLLGTSMLHMLPEAKEDLPDYGELVFCCGFLLLYLVDEIAHYFLMTSDGAGHSHGHDEYSQNYAPTRRSSYQNCHEGFLHRNPEFEPNVLSTHSNFFARKKSTHQYGTVPSAPQTGDEEESFLCHGPHVEPCANSSTSHIALALALTIHSILEGLAIGLQKEIDEVFLLIGAVVSHKLVMAFCLGLELAESASTVCRYTSAMLFFAGGSSLGIGLGMLAFSLETASGKIILSVLQGLAGGTLLYVTVSEVLPRERARWHNSPRSSPGLVQFFSTAFGFVGIFFINKYLEIHH